MKRTERTWVGALVRAGILVFGVSLATAAGAQTAQPLGDVHLRIKRNGERPVIPITGADVWRLNVDLPLLPDFDPNRQALDISITGPNGELHIAPLHVAQLLPQRRGRWLITSALPNGGSCRVVAKPKARSWRLAINCHDNSLIPPFPDTTTFEVAIQFGSNLFASQPGDFRQLTPIVRRFP